MEGDIQGEKWRMNLKAVTITKKEEILEVNKIINI